MYSAQHNQDLLMEVCGFGGLAIPTYTNKPHFPLARIGFAVPVVSTTFN